MSTSLHLKKHTIGFTFALAGIYHTFKTQPNLRIHTLAAVLVLNLAAILGVNRIEWLILLFTIMWVITAEMINTALENVVNLLTHDYLPEAKIAKDVAAGMVLVGAIGSVIVGLVIFTPHLIKLIG